MDRRRLWGLIVVALLGTAAVAQPKVAFMRAQPGRMMTWDESRHGSVATYVVGGLSLTLSSQTAPGAPIPVLNVIDRVNRTIRVEGAQGFPRKAVADFGVFRLDPENPTPQVVLSTSTGGVHCCIEVEVLQKLRTGWKSTHLGTFDQESPVTFPDLDGDGYADMIFVDDAFDYTFASFGGSVRPPVIYNLRRGEFWNVSAEPKYRPLYAQQMSHAQKDCESGKLDRNGACAAFVADAARVGRLDWAWQDMLRSYERRNELTVLPTGCRVRPVKDACPAGETLAFADFPQALDWFLREHGYIRNPNQPVDEPLG